MNALRKPQPIHVHPTHFKQKTRLIAMFSVAADAVNAQQTQHAMVQKHLRAKVDIINHKTATVAQNAPTTIEHVTARALHAKKDIMYWATVAHHAQVTPHVTTAQILNATTDIINHKTVTVVRHAPQTRNVPAKKISHAMMNIASPAIDAKNFQIMRNASTA